MLATQNTICPTIDLAPQAGAQPQSGPRVLLAESNESRRRAVETVLAEVGYDATGCADVEGILRRAKQNAPDVVLLDATLPHGQPEQCIRALKRCYQTASVAIILSCPHQFNRQRLAEMIREGASAVLPRPYTRTQLLEAVLTAAARAKAQRTDLAAQLGIQQEPTRRVESSPSLLVRQVHCVLHDDRPALNRYLLRQNSVVVEYDFFGQPIYKSAGTSNKPVDFDVLSVMVCPRCYFASSHAGYFLDPLEQKEPRHRFEAATRRALIQDFEARKAIADGTSPGFFEENRTIDDARAAYALATRCSLILYQQNPFSLPAELLRLANYHLCDAQLALQADPNAASESRRAAVEPLKKATVVVEGEGRYKAAQQLVALGIALGDRTMAQQYFKLLTDMEAANLVQPNSEIKPYLQRAREAWESQPVENPAPQ